MTPDEAFEDSLRRRREMDALLMTDPNYKPPPNIWPCATCGVEPTRGERNGYMTIELLHIEGCPLAPS